MHHARQKQQGLRKASPELLRSVLEPFGSWMQAYLETLPRFPHRDSFPAAKGLISQFLQEGLTYQDLRIALFWLGFGLLDVPVAEEPTMSLVPLCKDLNTYEEIATELGYDPTASVHLQPVALPFCQEPVPVEQGRSQTGSATSSGSSHSNGVFVSSAGSSSSSPTVGTSAASESPSTRIEPSKEDERSVAVAVQRSWDAHRETQMAFAPLPRVRSRGAEGCATRVLRAALDVDSIPEEDGNRCIRRDARGFPPRLGELPQVSGASCDPPVRRNHRSQMRGSREEGGWAPCRPSSPSAKGKGAVLQGGNSSSYYEGPESGEDDQLQAAVGAASSQELLDHKVKLFYAGGWSDSSSSEGHRTPPTPPVPASSSTGGGIGPTLLQAGGLDTDHVEQFTVSFISDVQMHEDLEEISCLCTFCLDDMKVGEELCRLPCMHTFHRRCVHAWLERDRRCMLCRLDITRPRG